MTKFKIKISWINREGKRAYTTINVDAENEQEAEDKLDNMIMEPYDYDVESITPA